MKGYSVYNAIKQLKDQGFKKAAVARQLDINRRTVDRYWDMSVDEYEAMKSEVRRKQALDKYQDAILGWLKDYPSISSAQILDWLKENYDAYFSERTVSRYVKELREKFNLPKHADKRTYEAVPELPMGKQAQVGGVGGRVGFGLAVPAVDVDEVAHVLEGIEADADGQTQARQGDGRAQQAVDRADEKIGVLEKQQEGQIPAQAADENAPVMGPFAETQTVEPAHQSRQQQKQHIPRLTGGVEHQAGQQQHMVFQPPRRQVVQAQGDRQEEI